MPNFMLHSSAILEHSIKLENYSSEMLLYHNSDGCSLLHTVYIHMLMFKLLTWKFALLSFSHKSYRADVLPAKVKSNKFYSFS